MFLVDNRATALLHLGRWSEAERLLSEVLADAGSGTIASLLRMLRAWLSLLAGRYEAASDDLAAAIRAPAWGGDETKTLVISTRIGLALAGKDIETARSHVREGLEAAMKPGAEDHRWPLFWLALRVEADAPVAAADRVSSLTQQIDVVRAQTPPARAYRALAAAEAARATGEQSRWSEAVDACRQAGDPYLIAYALLRGAEADVGAGVRDRATAALEESVRLAGAMGAAPLLEEAHALARRARLKLDAGEADVADGEATGDAFGLTSREREVLALVAEGLSNPQIAQALFISRKTASVHVSNIIGKLNVSSRGEAAALAHRLGLDSAPESG
jgi:DNA-binding NarL/FixJ family response regulator